MKVGVSLALRHGPPPGKAQPRTPGHQRDQNRGATAARGPILLLTLPIIQPNEPWPPAANMPPPRAPARPLHHLGVATVISDHFSPVYRGTNSTFNYQTKGFWSDLGTNSSSLAIVDIQWFRYIDEASLHPPTSSLKVTKVGRLDHPNQWR